MPNTYTTYDMVGQVEDVSDVIENISPSDTPFITSIGRGSTKAKLFEWQEDELNPPADPVRVEGWDAVESALTPTTMRRNRVQLISDAIKVSGSANAVETYGRAREIAYQTAKKGKELKIALERNLIGKVQNATVGNATTTPARTGNVFGQDADGVQIIAPAVTFGNSGINRAFSEQLMLNAMQKLYAVGGKATIVMIPPSLAQKVAAFANAAGRMRDFGGGRQIVNAVDVYVGPFGSTRVVLNRHMRSLDTGETTNEVLLFDPEYWQLVTLRGWQTVPLAKIGDSERTLLLWEGGLKHRAYKASARITDLDNS